MKKIIYKISALIVAVTIFSSIIKIKNCSAQWVQTNGPYGDLTLHCLGVSGTNLFCGTTFEAGVFLSTNNGTNWTAVNNGLLNKDIYALTVSGTNIFAGTGDGVFLSIDNGDIWTSVGLTIYRIYALTVSGTNLFAGTGSGVFLSTNNGTNWVAVNNGLTNPDVWVLTASGTNLFAGIYDGGVFLSTNNGNSWTAVNNGLTNPYVWTFTTSGTNLFAGTSGGVFLTTNNGNIWTSVGLANLVVNALTVSGTNLFAGTCYSGVLLSTNNGNSWLNINQGFGNINTIYSLIIANSYIFAGTYGHSVWRRSLAEIIGISKISENVPSSYSLSQNYPNPFNPLTVIRYSIPSLSSPNIYGGKRSSFSGANPVTLKVYDILGKEIATLVNEKQSPGTYEVTFDGSQYPSGVYFYKLTSGNFMDTKKLLLIK